RTYVLLVARTGSDPAGHAGAGERAPADRYGAGESRADAHVHGGRGRRPLPGRPASAPDLPPIVAPTSQGQQSAGERTTPADRRLPAPLPSHPLLAEGRSLGLTTGARPLPVRVKEWFQDQGCGGLARRRSLGTRLGSGRTPP